jgi:hypothetical protein
MWHSLRYFARRLARLGLALSAIVAGFEVSPATAQKPNVHYRYPAPQQPTGLVGATRLQQGGPVQGYFQPVELTGPDGVLISLADQGGWTDPVEGTVHAGMLIGAPYRVKLDNLPEEFNLPQCYPTIEIVDRTYAPQGLERRFPIPVVFNEDDIRQATRGMLVTRVIYIEDPQQAIPGRQLPGDQLWHDAGSQANPLEVADRLGRPVAIVRLGARMPDERSGPDMEFTYGCPPWRRLSAPVAAEVPSTPAEVPMQQARNMRAAAKSTVQ